VLADFNHIHHGVEIKRHRRATRFGGGAAPSSSSATAPPVTMMDTHQSDENEDHDEEEDLTKAAKCYQPLIRKGRTNVQFGTEAKYQEGKAIIVDFLRRLALRNCFTCALEKTGCSCIKDNFGGGLGGGGFSSWIPHVAEKLLSYQSMDAKRRMSMKMDAIKLTASWKNVDGKPCPRLPIQSMAIGKPPAEETGPSSSFFICKHAYFALLAMKKGTYTTLRKSIQVTNEQPEHRLTGKVSNNALKATLQACLCVFFEEMIELGSPRATRFIRMEVGMEVRDCDDEMLELPSSFTKRGLYVRFCKEIGYKARLKNDNGQYEYVVEEMDLIPEEETVVNGNVVTTKILKPPSFATFLAFWFRNYAHVVIPKAREDVCNDCFVLSNSFRYFASRRNTNAGHDGRGSQQHEEEDEQQGKGGGVNGYESREKAVELARIHVERAKAQREYFNEISRHCADDESDVLVMDFMQNLGVPYLGSEQAGATYYFSPLTVNCFGVVDMKTDKLHVFVYHEGQGKKGSNNVASMIWEYLRMYNKLRRDDEGKPIRRKSLKIVMDNCSGQNKNKVVLRMALFLAETGFYLDVEFVFLIVGHTKNPCDRMFNLLKLFYRLSNCYTIQQTLEKLNEHEDTVATEFTDHRDWESRLDKLYRGFDSGTIKRYHNFFVDFDNKPNFMMIRISTRKEDNAEHLLVEKDFSIADTIDPRERQILLSTLPELLVQPGIPAIKQIELATKWRKFVPPQFQDEICPLVSPEVLKTNREERSQKRKDKTNAGKEQNSRRRRTTGGQPSSQQQSTAAANNKNNQDEIENSPIEKNIPTLTVIGQGNAADQTAETNNVTGLGSDDATQRQIQLAWLAHHEQLRVSYMENFPYVNRHY
jgi:hypothetical protein